ESRRQAAEHHIRDQQRQRRHEQLQGDSRRRGQGRRLLFRLGRRPSGGGRIRRRGGRGFVRRHGGRRGQRFHKVPPAGILFRLVRQWNDRRGETGVQPLEPVVVGRLLLRIQQAQLGLRQLSEDSLRDGRVLARRL